MVEFITVKHSDAVVVLQIFFVLVLSIIPSSSPEIFYYVVTVWDGLLWELLKSGLQHIICFPYSLKISFSVVKRHTRSHSETQNHTVDSLLVQI